MFYKTIPNLYIKQNNLTFNLFNKEKAKYNVLRVEATGTLIGIEAGAE